jgi:hypothetical protein
MVEKQFNISIAPVRSRGGSLVLRYNSSLQEKQIKINQHGVVTLRKQSIKKNKRIKEVVFVYECVLFVPVCVCVCVCVRVCVWPAPCYYTRVTSS